MRNSTRLTRVAGGATAGGLSKEPGNTRVFWNGGKRRGRPAVHFSPGKKAQYDYAVRTAAHGGNPMLAYMNTQLRRPLRTFSWVLLVLSVLILCISHYIKNRKRSKVGVASQSAE